MRRVARERLHHDLARASRQRAALRHAQRVRVLAPHAGVVAGLRACRDARARTPRPPRAKRSSPASSRASMIQRARRAGCAQPASTRSSRRRLDGNALSWRWRRPACARRRARGGLPSSSVQPGRGRADRGEDGDHQPAPCEDRPQHPAERGERQRGRGRGERSASASCHHHFGAAACCFALIASSRILMPSCDAVDRLRERLLREVEIVERRAVGGRPPFPVRVRLAVLARAPPCSASSGTPTSCAGPNLLMSCASQNSALRTLPW